MPEATIKYETPTDGWPHGTTLVELDPPLRRFDVLTGDPIDYPYVMVHVRSPETFPGNTGVTLFPSNEAGEFVSPTMQPIGEYPYGMLHSVLKQMGYDVTN